MTAGGTIIVRTKIKPRGNAMAAVFKYSALVLYAAATSFACFIVFTSSAGNYDASTEELLPLLQIGTEALYFIIVISVYAIARMRGRDNLKTFCFITRSFGLRFFRCRNFVISNGMAGTASVLLTALCAPLFFSSRRNLKGLCGITLVLAYLIAQIYFEKDNTIPLLVFLHIIPSLTVIKLLSHPKQAPKKTQQISRQTGFSKTAAKPAARL